MFPVLINLQILSPYYAVALNWGKKAELGDGKFDFCSFTLSLLADLQWSCSQGDGKKLLLSFLITMLFSEEQDSSQLPEKKISKFFSCCFQLVTAYFILSLPCHRSEVHCENTKDCSRHRWRWGSSVELYRLYFFKSSGLKSLWTVWNAQAFLSQQAHYLS